MKDHRPTRVSCRVTRESFHAFMSLWLDSSTGLRWDCPFVLPPWLNAWWSTAASEAGPLLLAVRQGETVVGLAPWQVLHGRVSFMGDPQVCDYFDLVTVPGFEDICVNALLAHLASEGLSEVELGPFAPGAAALRGLSRPDLPFRPEWHSEPEDVYSSLPLPPTWEGFLETLGGKQRHELQRKLRRLHEAGPVTLRAVREDAQAPEAVESFFRLFAMSRSDKAAFMNEAMTLFFRALMRSLSQCGMLRLFFLDLGERPVASAFCFDHQGTRYLYNSAYDSGHKELSVGLMVNALSLKAAIQGGFSEYNFLKGKEVYKARLGGSEAPLLRCRLKLAGGLAAVPLPSACESVKGAD